MGKTKITVAILVLALALFIPFAIQAGPTPTPPGQHLNITQVFVDVPPGQITINGTDLDFGPGPLVVTLGNFGPLHNCSGDDMTIVCDLPKVILKGDYLLTVSNGSGQSQGDEYDLTICSDLAACFDANNWSNTEDGKGFIADCISSAGCPAAEKDCTTAGEEFESCFTCIHKGADCDICNEELIGRFRCINVCEKPCFDANNWSNTEDGKGFIADCISSAGCGEDAQDICENATEIKECTVCISLGTSCDGCNEVLADRFECTNVCGGGPIPVPN